MPNFLSPSSFHVMEIIAAKEEQVFCLYKENTGRKRHQL